MCSDIQIDSYILYFILHFFSYQLDFMFMMEEKLTNGAIKCTVILRFTKDIDFSCPFSVLRKVKYISSGIAIRFRIVINNQNQDL